MSAPITVSVAALQRALTAVLDEVARQHGDEVELTADHYWVLTPRAAYDLTADPDVRSCTVAQLSDDVATVREILGRADDEEEVLSPWHDLAHLAGILQRLAAQDRPPARA
ncbi:hypothetical protein ACI8AA_21795 [Geodermatophilus sp. SYSU D01180]